MGREEKAERQLRLLRTHDLMEFGQVASGSERLRRRKQKGEEEEPATEWRRECIDLGSDLGERNEHVTCYASALALAIDESCREADISAKRSPSLL